MVRTARLTDQLILEWAAFHDAMTARRPDRGTACEAWTVRDIAAHQAGNAEELARILGAHLEGGPVPPTQSFEEREPRYRELDDRALERALAERIADLAVVVDRAMEGDPDALVPWTGRRMRVRWFAEHMREELVIHRWDIIASHSRQVLGLAELGQADPVDGSDAHGGTTRGAASRYGVEPSPPGVTTAPAPRVPRMISSMRP